jgi:hypothetical protein
MEPPTSRVSQMAASSTGKPYTFRTRAGTKEHVDPNMTAMGKLIVKSCCSFINSSCYKVKCLTNIKLETNSIGFQLLV